ncbi:MAG TPA: hypothetical protein VN441_16845 [Syntrophomonas sp.]|nr:hypothetical protein [Syntrophomonas sp.]
MINRYKLLPALLLLLWVSGCATASGSAAGDILPPAYEICPLEGKWSVTEELGPEGYSDPAKLETAGRLLQFSRETAIIDRNVWNQPTYKIKKVNANDYITTRYTVLDRYLTAVGKTVEVVTVFADSNYLGEFMKMDDGGVIAFVQNKALLLHKVAEHADDPRSMANANVDDDQYNNTGAAGIFIGLKIPSDSDYVYETLWVAADNKKLHPVLRREDIYFPRQSGFWELQIKQGEDGATLSAHNVAEKNLPTSPGKVAFKGAAPGSDSIVIDYIGNDYVAITDDTGGIAKLQFLPVDKLSSPIGIKVADLLGEAGVKVYRGAREQARQILHSQGVTRIDEDINEDNFGLTRKHGHWQLQGRINYQNQGVPGTMDFNINYLPPANLIFYDTLYPSWQSIKDRVPNALDALTSPDKDIAVIKTKSRLYIFGINGEQLDSVPLGEVELKAGTTIVMAEWATGFYVNDWERNFLANGAKAIGK